MMEMPYFMRDKNWYIELMEKNGDINFKLTPEAPPKAVESYKKFYKAREEAKKKGLQL